MIDIETPTVWVNPVTGRTHCIGQRVMWVHGRKSGVDYGETGTVLSIPIEGDPESKFMVQFDYPTHKRDPNSGRFMEITSQKILTVADAARQAANRLRSHAQAFDKIADEYDDLGRPIPEAQP